MIPCLSHDTLHESKLTQASFRDSKMVPTTPRDSEVHKKTPKATKRDAKAVHMIHFTKAFVTVNVYAQNGLERQHS